MFEMATRPASGRMFAASRRVRLGDCSPGGRLRLDATARYLHDVSDDDTRDAGLGQMTWVVRRTVIDVHRFPTYLEPLDLVTWCSGIGSRWAERRVDIGSAAVAVASRRRVDQFGDPVGASRRCDASTCSSCAGLRGGLCQVRSRADGLVAAGPGHAAAWSRPCPVAGSLHRFRRDGPREQCDCVRARGGGAGPPSRVAGAPTSRGGVPIRDRP